jgi:hypothetical protein
MRKLLMGLIACTVLSGCMDSKQATVKLKNGSFTSVAIYPDEDKRGIGDSVLVRNATFDPDVRIVKSGLYIKDTTIYVNDGDDLVTYRMGVITEIK